MDVATITPIRAKNEFDVLWLDECLATIYGQSVQPAEVIVVDDHSVQDLGSVREKWHDAIWLNAEGKGVSAARNQAADRARSPLLLPVDADDKLGRPAIELMAGAFSGEGIVYSDVIFFGPDWSKVYLAEEYDFKKLLHATFMTVGCLHRKEDWRRVGGWREDMTRGLEDWEYWIALGEMGVCGTRVPVPLYWYRRHSQGRLAWLKSNLPLWQQAYLRMRELHQDSFNGRFPMGCCSGGGVAPQKSDITKAVHNIPQEQIVDVQYTGKRYSFELTGGVTKTRYYIPGPGEMVTMTPVGRQGVRREDVPWFLSIRGGRDYKVIEPPVAAAPPPRAVEMATPASSEAWEPEVMEGSGEEQDFSPFDMDITKMTVEQIRLSNFPANWIPALIEQEKATKNRKTALAYLHDKLQ